MNKLQNAIFSYLIRKRTSIDIKIKLSRNKRTRVKNIIPESKMVILNSGERLPVTSINSIRIFGKHAEEFSRFIKPMASLEENKNITHFLNKRIFIYPHGEKKYYGKLLGFFPYLTVLKLNKIVEIKFHIYISAFSFLKPYWFTKENLEANPVAPGSWRKDWKELRRLLKGSLPRKKGRTITFVLRDGREITGFLFRKDLFKDKWKLRIKAPENLESSSPTMFIMKHAIEDFWEEE
jgi:hypothetical protein